MKSRSLVLAWFITPLLAFSQEPRQETRQAIYLNTLGRTLLTVSYHTRLFPEFELLGGAGLNDFDRTASTAIRIGASYVRGSEHLFELSLFYDMWTKIANPIAREEAYFGSFLGYRYQPDRGVAFRLGVDPLRLNERFFDFGERVQGVVQASIGYSF